DHVDAGFTQLLDVLPTFLVGRARRVGMGELVNQGDLRTSLENGIEVHLLEHGAAVLDALARDQLEAGEELLGAGSSVSLDVGDGDILAALLSLPTLFEHGERLARARRRSQVDLQPPATPCRRYDGC